MKIAIDLDGTVANITDELIERLSWDGIHVTEDEFMYEKIEDCFDVEEGWIKGHFDDPTFWLNATPYEDAWYCINKWFGAGHDIFIVTGRWHDTPSCRWLDEWDIPYNDIYFDQPKGGKHTTIQKLGCDFMIDDRTIEVNPMVDEGVNALLINRPWNQRNKTKAIRIDSFYDVDKVVEIA